MPLSNSAMTSSPRGRPMPRRRVPWWALWWPPHVQLAVAHAGDVTGPQVPAQVPAYGGGPGLAYGSPGLALADRPLTSVREWPLGFGLTVIPEGAIVSVVARPQVIFRGERLFIPSTIAFGGGIGVVDIKVGNRSQLANSAMLPAQIFDENSVGVRLSCDTAQPAQDVAIVVKDLSGLGGIFTAAMVGTAVL